MDAALGEARTLPRRSLGEIIAISVFYLALNLHWGAIATNILPGQVIELLLREAPGGSLAAQAAWVNDHKGLTLAIVAAPGLVVALISNPFFGLLSDRTPGRFGRRRPYIVAGTTLNVVGLALMALAPTALVTGHSGNALAPSILVLMGALMFTQLVSNCAQAPFHALLPDIVPAAQRGVASGVMGFAQLLGSIAGFVVPALFGFNSAAVLEGQQSIADYHAGVVRAYAIVGIAIAIFAAITVLTVREQPWTRTASASLDKTWRKLLLTVVAVLVVVGGSLALVQAHVGLSLDTGSLSALQLVALAVAGVGTAWAFDFRPRLNPDFSWVLVTRMLVQMGIYIVLTFLQFYMLDVAHAPNPQGAVAIFGTILLLTAALTTAAAGWLSDHWGRKRMVYLSGAFMALVGAAFVVAPYLVPGHVLTLAYGAGAVFGLGYGAYIAVDWALVADVLPSETTYARDMGVWNIGLTIPQVLAAILGGWFLALGILLGSKGLGYTFLFVAFVVFCVLGTVTVRYIKGVR